MGSMREIRARIKSVKNTQQITKTMKMVASAKLRRTQKGLNGIRSFAESSRHILCLLYTSPPLLNLFSLKSTP